MHPRLSILSLGLTSATSREGLIGPVVSIYNMTVSCFSNLHLSPVSQNSLKKSALQLRCSHISVLSPSSRAAPRFSLTNVCLSGQQVILLSLNSQHPHPNPRVTKCQLGFVCHCHLHSGRKSQSTVLCKAPYVEQL